MVLLSSTLRHVLRRSFAAGTMPPPPTPTAIPGVKHVIGVGSGKGGVGKSTVSVNLAVALAQSGPGLRVGVLDADVFGPSIPTLLGLDASRPEVTNGMMKPKEAHGIVCNSMGFLVEPGAPVVWRGLMVMKALEQLAHQTAWGELDILVVDMPPGTGDVHLTLVQRIVMAGAVVVSTPQRLALDDVRRALGMFQQVKMPVLGLVENMANFSCPSCGSVHDLFGEGGVAEQATAYNTEVLASLPLVPAVRVASDAGTPLTAGPNAARDPASREYFSLAGKILHKLAIQ